MNTKEKEIETEKEEEYDKHGCYKEQEQCLTTMIYLYVFAFYYNEIFFQHLDLRMTDLTVFVIDCNILVNEIRYDNFMFHLEHCYRLLSSRKT